jgi:hypothetical protein
VKLDRLPSASRGMIRQGFELEAQRARPEHGTLVGSAGLRPRRMLEALAQHLEHGA